MSCHHLNGINGTFLLLLHCILISRLRIKITHKLSLVRRVVVRKQPSSHTEY